MPLDPSILAQGKPFQMPDPLQNYAKVLQIQNAQNQNALAQYQLGTAKRGEEGQNALSRAQQAAYDPETGTYDMNKLRGSMISGGFGALLPDVEKKMGELRSQQLTQQKTEGEVVAGRTKQFRDLLTNVNNPSAAAQWLQAQYKDPVLGPVVSRMPLDQALAEIPTDPAKFNEWRSQNALGMEEFIKQNKPTTFETGTGQVKQRMSMPGLGGAATVVPGSTMQQVPTPGEVMSNKVALGNLAIAQQKLAREGANLDPAEQAAVSKAIIEGRVDPNRVNGRNAKIIANTLLTQPDANLTELGVSAAGAMSGGRALGTQSATILVAANEAAKMIDVVRADSAAVDRTKYPNINAIQNAIDKGTGGKEIVQLNASINALVNSYARAINPRGVATVSDKNHAREVINSAYSKGQIESIMERMQTEMDIAKASPGEAAKQLREQRTGKPAPSVGGGNWKDL